MTNIERRIGSPFSESLGYAFLSRRVNRAFLRFPHNNTEGDRTLFRKCEEFFTQALRGKKVGKTLRVTATAADEARTYGWALAILDALPPEITQIVKKEDIQTALESFRDTLKSLQGPEAFKVEKEQIKRLQAFFDQMGEIVRSTQAEPFDIVNIRGVLSVNFSSMANS